MLTVNDTGRLRTAPPPPPPPPPPPRAVDAGRGPGPLPPPAAIPADAGVAGRHIVQGARDPVTGVVDTQRLAGHVMDAARHRPDAARQGYEAILAELARTNAGDASRFQRDVDQAARRENARVAEPTAGHMAIGAGEGLRQDGVRRIAAGDAALRANPILSINWEVSRSGWTGRTGFSGPLATMLNDAGIGARTNAGVPPGSVGRSSGLAASAANNINGQAGEAMIADRYRRAGFDVTVAPAAANQAPGSRVIDVVATRAGATPRDTIRIETESKVGYTSGSAFVRSEVARDAARLADNRATRTAGDLLIDHGATLRTVGRIARPVGVVLDAVSLGSAWQADGGRFGSATREATGSLVGGAGGAWGGAAGGAAIGTLIFPGVGTVIGGVAGGIVGGIAGSSVGKSIAGWFG